MKIKTTELQGAALDWAVAKCEGEEIEYFNPLCSFGVAVVSVIRGMYSPSTDWAQGGPIIEREKVCVAWLTKQDLGMEPEHYCVAHIDGIYTRYGPTPLIAAMRCYARSQLGDEVEVPDQLFFEESENA